VGWCVEDDCHVVRSRWKRRGAGTAHAYLNRLAILRTIEAATGFSVETTYGYGDVLGCVVVGSAFRNCRFCVAMKEYGRCKDNILWLNCEDIVSCHGAQFVPVTEHLRGAANYQIQIDQYYAMLRDHRLNDGDPPVEHEFQIKWAVWADILWSSFLKAVAKDTEFDSSLNELINSVVDFLEKLDKPADEDDHDVQVRNESDKNHTSKTKELPSIRYIGTRVLDCKRSIWWCIYCQEHQH
jgi:uncharacterized protein YihD (DUF1040 family)